VALEAHGNDAAGGGKARGPESQAPEGQSESSDRSDLSDMSDQAPPTGIRFAGATFVPAASDDGSGGLRGMTKALGALGIEVAA
jgi:hypothetical protein